MLSTLPTKPFVCVEYFMLIFLSIEFESIFYINKEGVVAGLSG